MELIVCLSLLGYCLALTRFSKWPIEYTPFFVVSAVVVLLYCFAGMHFLKIGADSLLTLGGALLFLSPLFLFSHRHVLTERYATPGFIVSLIFLTVFLILARQGHFSGWDEFAQWGPHSQLVFLNNGFIRASDATACKSYPPGSALFHYLFFRVSGYHEGTAYLAQCLLMMASLFIFTHGYSWKSWQKTVIAYAATLILFLLLHTKIGPSESLYMDDAVGIYIGMTMVAYLGSSKKIDAILYLIPIIATLSLLKPKLYPLVLIATTIILVDQFVTNKKNIFLMLLTALILPGTNYLTTTSWHHYLNTIGTPLARQLHLTIAQIKNTLFAPPGSFSHAVIVNYIHALKPALFFLCVILSLTLITYYCYAAKNKRVSLLAISATLFLGFIAYIFGLLLMYLFTFVPYEAIHHASMSRYLHIYYLIWSLVALYFLFDATRSITKKYCRAIENGFVFLIIMGFIIFLCLPHKHKNKTQSLRQSVMQIATAVKQITKPHDSVFSIWQNTTGLPFAMLTDALVPRKLNSGCHAFGKSVTSQDIWTCHLTPKDLQKQFRHFDYLLLAYTDKNFWSHYQSILPDRKKLKPIAIYTVCMKNAFNAFGSKGCHPEKQRAYLLKIMRSNNQIYFLEND